jgi:hypothetical protein
MSCWGIKFTHQLSVLQGLRGKLGEPAQRTEFRRNDRDAEAGEQADGERDAGAVADERASP